MRIRDYLFLIAVTGILGFVFILVTVFLPNMYIDCIAYNAVIDDQAYLNDMRSTNLELLSKGEPYDSSMPYTYIYKYHNSTGDQLVRVYLNQNNGSVESIGYNEPGYMYLMNR